MTYKYFKTTQDRINDDFLNRSVINIMQRFIYFKDMIAIQHTI